MRKYMKLLLVLVLVISQNASILQIAYASNAVQQLFDVAIAEGSTTDKTTLHVTVLKDEYANVSIELPVGSVYNQAETAALNSELEAELQYEVSKHILHLNGQNAIPKTFALVLEDLNEVEEMTFAVTDEEEKTTKETHVLQLINNDPLLMRNVQQDSASKVEVAALSETDNISVSFHPVQEPVLSGDDIAYVMEVKLTGSKGEVKDAKLTLNFEETEYITFDQSTLEKLAIAGVTPTYEKNQLVYEFDELKKGQSYERVVKFNTVNGYLPEGTKFKVTGSLEGKHVTTSNEEKETSEQKEEDFKVNFHGENTIKASGTLNLSKVALDSKNKPGKTLYTTGDIVHYKMELKIPQKSKGQLYLSEGHKVVLTDTLPAGLEYVSMIQGPAPKKSGQQLTWEFDVPTLKEQEKLDDLLDKTIMIKAKVTSESDGKSLKNNAELQAHFLDEAASTATSTVTSASSIYVGKAPSAVDIVDGSYYVPQFAGPSNGEGGMKSLGNTTAPIEVTPDAYLGFQFSIMPKPHSFEGSSYNEESGRYTVNIDNNLTDYKELEYILKIDNDLVLQEFSVPKEFVFQINKKSPQKKLKKQPTYDLKGIVNGKTKVLVPASEVEPGKVYTREELGLEPTDHISEIGFDFKYAPAGLRALPEYRPKAWFTVKPGKTGKMTNRLEIKGKSGDNQVFNYDKPYYQTLTWIAPRSVIVKDFPASAYAVGEVSIDLLEEKKSFVETGDNRVSVKLTPPANSAASLKEKLETVFLLPVGVTLNKNPKATYKGANGGTTTGKYEVLDDNYNNSGRQLVKVEWPDEKVVNKGQELEAQLDVTITDQAPSLMKFDVFGYTGTKNVKVPTYTNNVFTNTVLEEDTEDLNGNNNATEQRFKAGNIYYLIGQYDLQTKKEVKGANEKEYNLFTTVRPGATVDYRLSMTNTTKKDLGSMVLIDVLPSVNDLGITDNINRGSQFGLTLDAEGVKVPQEWENKVDIYYSTSENPKRDDLTKHTKGAVKLGNPE